MLRMLTALACLVCVAAGLTGPTFGQPGELKDSIGIYFDSEGNTTRFQTTQLDEAVLAWLILKNMSSTAGICGIAVCGDVRFTIPPVGFCWMSLVGGQNFYCEPLWGLAVEPPLPQTPLLAIVMMWFYVPTPATKLDLHVVPFPGEELFYYTVDFETTLPLTPSSGSCDIPVAVVNGGVVGDIGTSWGGIKACYR